MVTMKHFLFICALISAVALINGSSIESDGFDILGGRLLSNDDLRITEEQKKCIEDGVQKVKDENPNLKEWFDDIERTFRRITKLSDKCNKLNGVAQKICHKLLSHIAKAEGKRLFGNPTEEQKVVLAKVQEIENECLKEEAPPGETKVAFDASDLLQTNGVRATDEQEKCIQDGYLKVKANNPSLQSWFNNIEQTLNNLAEAKQKENYESVINTEDFVEMTFNFFVNSTAITEEQVDCIKEGYKKVITENPELQAWFDEVETVSKQLAQAAQECEAQSGLNQLKCYVKLIKTAQNEIRRLVNVLSAAQKEILKALADVVKDCLSSKNA